MKKIFTFALSLIAASAFATNYGAPHDNEYNYYNANPAATAGALSFAGAVAGSSATAIGTNTATLNSESTLNGGTVNASPIANGGSIGSGAIANTITVQGNQAYKYKMPVSPLGAMVLPSNSGNNSLDNGSCPGGSGAAGVGTAVFQLNLGGQRREDDCNHRYNAQWAVKAGYSKEALAIMCLTDSFKAIRKNRCEKLLAAMNEEE